MRIRLQIDVRNLGGPGRDSPPVGVVLLDLSMQARRIDAQDPHTQPLVLGDVSLRPVGRDRGVSSFEELALAVSVERIDEPYLADRDPVRRGSRSPCAIENRKRVAALGGLLDSLGNPDGPERCQRVGP